MSLFYKRKGAIIGLMNSEIQHQFEGAEQMKTFTAYIEWDPETKLYVGMVPGIPGAHTQGASLDELHKNLREVLELCLEEVKEAGEIADFPQFFGLQQIEVVV